MKIISKLTTSLLKGPIIKSSDDHWIPFKVDPIVKGFSHKNYTGLFFQNDPGEYQLEREFRKLLYGRNHKWIRLIDHLSFQLDYYEKLDFFDKILSEVNGLLSGHLKYNLLGDYNRDKIKDQQRAKSIKKIVGERMKAVKKEPDQFFLWKTEDSHVVNFCEWALIPIINGDVDVKNQEEFVHSLGKVFGIQFKKGVYTTTKSRIEGRKKHDEFYSHRFIEKLWKLASERTEKLHVIQKPKQVAKKK